MEPALLVIQITDLHILAKSEQTKSGINTEQSFRQVIEVAIKNHANADLLLVTGDLAQDPCESSYNRIAKELNKHKIRTLCLPGNHDNLPLMQQCINSKQINCDKQLLSKNWQILCLNSQKEGSHEGFIAKQELLFLTEKLSKNSDLYTLISIHHPPVLINSFWMDQMTIENNQELFSILSKFPNVKGITCGHIHQTLDMEKQNIQIFGTPSTCFQFKPNSSEYCLDDTDPGYRVFWLYPNGRLKSMIQRVPLT